MNYKNHKWVSILYNYYKEENDYPHYFDNPEYFPTKKEIKSFSLEDLADLRISVSTDEDSVSVNDKEYKPLHKRFRKIDKLIYKELKSRKFHNTTQL